MDKTYFGKIRTVFIDLDDTIWDFSANSKVAMRIVYEKYGLQDQFRMMTLSRVICQIMSRYGRATTMGR